MSDTVLVVDDNLQNRALAQATLEDAGYHVVVARSGAEGIAAAAQIAPRCIVMDVRMPGIDGIEACRTIRASPGGDAIAIIFVTAQREVDVFDRALAAGGDDFMTKPYRPDELLLRVQTAMHYRRGAAERDALVEELRHQRDRMQRLELLREQLVAFLVHDLKNPVNAIALDAQLLPRLTGAPERVVSTAARIHDSATNLLRMIMNLLDLARADAGGLQPAAHVVDPRALVARVLDGQRERATGHAVLLAAEIGVDTLRADPELLERVLANLVDNALRHTPEGGTIAVTAHAADGGVDVCVRDSGAGVPADQRERVFDRFASGASGAERAAGNRGLGLAFCKVAIEAHGGSIAVEDARPGACFRIHLPS